MIQTANDPADEGGAGMILLGGEGIPYTPSEFDNQAAALAARYQLHIATARTALRLVRTDVL